MSRILRLFACAAGMLAAAVLACMLLQDEETVNAGSHAVSGRIKGFEGADAPSAQKPESIVEENAEQKAENRSGAARVKVLELARAVAENKARAESAKPEPVQAEVPAVMVQDVQEVQARSEKAVEAEALALLTAEAPASKPEASKAEAPAAPRKVAPPTETKKPEQKAVPKKAEVKKAEKKAESANSARRRSPVESALADARSGRLSPGEDFMTESDPAATYDRVITSAKFSMKGSLIKLTLRGNSPMIGHFYVLEDPDRVVLDLAGNWKVDMPKVPSNRLIGAVRVGQHEDKTRLVFDMKEMGKVALVPLNRNALELRIQ